MLNLYNSLTCKIEPFTSARPPQVKMYTCGPSTYQRPHIGNYRTFLFEDLLQRYLEYQGYDVKRLITLTNIEDKAILQAQKEGVSIEELTIRNEAIFFQDFELLRIKRPDFTVRASDIVDQAVGLIQMLVSQGVAYPFSYQGRRNYYFDPLKFAEFGKLLIWTRKTGHIGSGGSIWTRIRGCLGTRAILCCGTDAKAAMLCAGIPKSAGDDPRGTFKMQLW